MSFPKANQLTGWRMYDFEYTATVVRFEFVVRLIVKLADSSGVWAIIFESLVR